MNISFQPDRFDDFNDPAKDEFEQQVVAFGLSIIKESHNIESAGERTTGGRQITSPIVNQAAGLIRAGRGKKRRNGWLITARILSAASCLLVGIIYDPDVLKDSSTHVTFFSLFGFAIITTVIAVVNEDS